MALLDVFKSKKQKNVREKKAEQKLEKPVFLETEQKQPEPIVHAKGKKSPDAYRILKSPHISEKATFLQESRQYVFKVWPNANKTEVKKAVRNLYGVNAESVRIINIHPKPRRFKMIDGFRPKYKKAIVTLKEGEKIELIPH